MGSKARNWILGAAFIAVLVLAGSWFLVTQPKLDEADETRMSVEDELARQDLLRAQLTTLRGQFEQIDTLRAELASLQTQVPAEAELSGYLRDLQSLAEAHGVTLISVNPGTPTTVLEPAPVAPPAPESVADAPAEDGTATTDVLPPAPTSRLVQLPIAMTVVGPHDGALAFLEAVQTGTSRLYLVTTFTSTSQQQMEASGGRPATGRGDLEINIDGFAYVLPADPTTVVPPADGQEAAPAPLPYSDRNVFSPVAGG
ncbi:MULTISPECIES: hypothetical protein [unclassified Actinotalea]|uniref:hypothetical protein n=1 Tax=unclassified Actinotalea TaxID=2638618 RepID=UPI0015F36068|nr:MULTISPECIES: hypothetical protein [unclassified Actinotalea]